MGEKSPLKRYIVCVDGVAENPGIPGSRNPTNISRLQASINRGISADAKGRIVKQKVEYFQAVSPASPREHCEKQVRDIVLRICQNVRTPADRIFLFGAGYGAHTVRMVASTLHFMGIPKSEHLEAFDTIYHAALNLVQSRGLDDSQNLNIVSRSIRADSCDLANIHLVGLLDALEYPSVKNKYVTRIMPTVRIFRHALAMDDSQSSNNNDIPETPYPEHMQKRSFVQAWFLGRNSDIAGGTQNDGLSIYPLQWMLIEAIRAGLVLSPGTASQDSSIERNPLSLAFPQHPAGLLEIDSEHLWRLKYRNGIEISMFDLKSIHVSATPDNTPSHSIRLEVPTLLQGTLRKIFSKTDKTLLGYESQQPQGVVIHPSVFCILYRDQSLLHQRRFKSYRQCLANFEADCFQGNSEGMPPWTQESELLDSNVKAFRILLCGKTGVGKSTLINRVFGVEITEESTSYVQGQHDINKAFESPNHPGLLIHDSRGWQAGSDEELELIAKFLRDSASRKNSAEALHVVWFCVDSDASRIEEADRRTFATIARFSDHVPVFVVGTKKDKVVAIHEMKLLEDYMERTEDYRESKRLANEEARNFADEQFGNLRAELAQIQYSKVEGYVCLSKDDLPAIRSLVTQTLDMIADERVRLFCVAAQVVDVEKKIDCAITECMRLGTHAIRTSMVPLPLTGMASTPTISRIICEHMLLCFGFPKTVPAEVDEVMSRIVLGNLKEYLTMSLAQFVVLAAASSGLALVTAGAGAVAWLAIPLLNAPTTARMVLKCGVEMILILERSFRYGGKFVTVKQIENAATEYVSTRMETAEGSSKRFQEHVRSQIDHLVPLKKVVVGWRFNRLRASLEQLIQKSRLDQPPEYEDVVVPYTNAPAELGMANSPAEELLLNDIHEMEGRPGTCEPVELDGIPTEPVGELPA